MDVTFLDLKSAESATDSHLLLGQADGGGEALLLEVAHRRVVRIRQKGAQPILGLGIVLWRMSSYHG